MTKITHDVNNNRASSIMLQIQRCEDFPIEIHNGQDGMKIMNKHDAEIFSIGMLMTLEMKIKEDVKMRE